MSLSMPEFNVTICFYWLKMHEKIMSHMGLQCRIVRAFF